MNEVLDFLYVLGCETDISDERMQALCVLLGVSWDDLCNHSIQNANQVIGLPATC